jgi:WS/DGAT/MGAT family acyltransferase
MTSYEPLSALDASFLDMERPDLPMHVGAVCIFEGAPLLTPRGAFRFDEVAEEFAARLTLAPKLRRRLMTVPFGLGRPVWVDDVHFDIADHLHLVRLPSPGTDRELLDLAAELHMHLLDRTRPLWEYWFVEGVEGGRIGVVQKIHHSLVDGVSGADLSTVLLDLDRAGRHAESDPWNPAPSPSPLALLGRSLAQNVTDAIAELRTLGRLRQAATPLATLAAHHPVAPPCSLNRPVGDHRRLEIVRQSLADIQHARIRLGGTVNDIVLAAVAGGVRQQLLARGDDVDGMLLNALVPVSVRAADEHGTLGNRVSALIAPLPVGAPDATARLRFAQDAIRSLRDRHEEAGTQFLLDLTAHAPPLLTGALSRLVHHQPFVNVVVTNVPGPQFPLYSMGAEMLDVWPIVPLAHNLSVGVAAFSYNGRLTIGLNADAVSCPDVDVLAKGIAASFDELYDLAAAHG